MRKYKEVPAGSRYAKKQHKLKGKFSIIHHGPKAALLFNQYVV